MEEKKSPLSDELKALLDKVDVVTLLSYLSPRVDNTMKTPEKKVSSSVSLGYYDRPYQSLDTDTLMRLYHLAVQEGNNSDALKYMSLVNGKIKDLEYEASSARDEARRARWNYDRSDWRP